MCRGAERCARWRQGDAESLRREARWLSGAGDGGADGAGARTRAVRELLSRGDRWGHTALHAAAGGGHTEAITLLASWGADAGAADW